MSSLRTTKKFFKNGIKKISDALVLYNRTAINSPKDCATKIEDF